MPTLIEVALGEWGESVRAGAASNPRVMEYLKTVGLASSDDISWCAAFVNWCTIKAGINSRPARAASARSWLEVGAPVTVAATGDLVIFWRESSHSWKGHVGIFIRPAPQDGVYVLGGNQGGRVGIAAYPARQVLGYRRLA